MKSPRLLPIVIFAAAALLVFKGIGLVTSGGYVLTGTQVARASEAGGEGGESGGSVENAAPRTEPTMSDSNPTLTDTSPTLATAPAGGEHGGEAPAHDAKDGAAGEHAGAEPTKPEGSAAENAASAAPGGAAAPPATDPTCPPVPTGAVAPSPADAHGEAAPAGAGAANCDAAVLKVDSDGKLRPVADPGGTSPTEQTLLERLAQRRAELDKRETALNMREAVVSAAEKQMQERADALKALQVQISQLDAQKKSMEGEQFGALVKMYETMKPQEAATIFDGLDMNVLMRVAKAMDPRKMSPVLAKMSSARAQELTIQLADGDPEAAPTTTAAADPNALPQIVGH